MGGSCVVMDVVVVLGGRGLVGCLCDALDWGRAVLGPLCVVVAGKKSEVGRRNRW